MPKYYDLDCRAKLKKLLKTILDCCKFHLVIKNKNRLGMLFNLNISLQRSLKCVLLWEKKLSVAGNNFLFYNHSSTFDDFKILASEQKVFAEIKKRAC